MRVAENKGITLFPVIRNNQPKLSSLSAHKRLGKSKKGFPKFSYSP